MRPRAALKVSQPVAEFTEPRAVLLSCGRLFCGLVPQMCLERLLIGPLLVSSSIGLSPVPRSKFHRPFMVSPSNHRPYIYLTTIFLRLAQGKSFFFDSYFNVSISPRMRASFLALLHPWSCCSLMRASC